MRLGAPIRFLALILGGWTLARLSLVYLTPFAVTLHGTPQPFAPQPAPLEAAIPSAMRIEPRYTGEANSGGFLPAPVMAYPAIRRASITPPGASMPAAPPLVRTPPLSADRPESSAGASPQRDAGQPIHASGVPQSPGEARWQLAAWALLRPDGGTPSLAEAGQLGGSQAGLRIAYRIAEPFGGALSLLARMSHPLEDEGAEAALGLALRPVRRLPIELSAERRIAIERGGRNTWAIGIAGGVDRVELPLALELDGYAQAGIVDVTGDADPYVDGAALVSYPLPLAGRTRLNLGGGAWGGVQPGAGRLDIGPSATLRVPVDRATLRISLDWRQRVAGDAQPGSGVALTVAAGF